jgi:hypothetical protein
VVYAGSSCYKQNKPKQKNKEKKNQINKTWAEMVREIQSYF